MNDSPLNDDKILAGLPTENGRVKLGNVYLSSKLGQGGMGAVYRGHHLKLNIDVAVKILPAELRQAAGNFLERFVQEAQASARIDHPNLLRVFEVDEESGTHYIVMEFIDGESASQLLARKGRIPEKEALAICVDTGEALAAAHAHNIIHRDVKPDNIMIRHADGRVKLADLGIAKVRDSTGSKTATGQAMGTPAFMSPDQAVDASSVDGRTDVYSLGATLYCLLTGAPPFGASSLYLLMKEVVEKDPPPVQKLAPGLSDVTANVVRRMMEKDPAKRHSSMKEAVAALRAALDSLPGGSAAVGPPTSVPTKTLDDVTTEEVLRALRETAAAETVADSPRRTLILIAVLIVALAAFVGNFATVHFLPAGGGGEPAERKVAMLKQDARIHTAEVVEAPAGEALLAMAKAEQAAEPPPAPPSAIPPATRHAPTSRPPAEAPSPPVLARAAAPEATAAAGAAAETGAPLLARKPTVVASRRRRAVETGVGEVPTKPSPVKRMPEVPAPVSDGRPTSVVVKATPSPTPKDEAMELHHRLVERADALAEKGDFASASALYTAALDAKEVPKTQRKLDQIVHAFRKKRQREEELERRRRTVEAKRTAAKAGGERENLTTEGTRATGTSAGKVRVEDEAADKPVPVVDGAIELEVVHESSDGGRRRKLALLSGARSRMRRELGRQLKLHGLRSDPDTVDGVFRSGEVVDTFFEETRVTLKMKFPVR